MRVSSGVAVENSVEVMNIIGMIILGMKILMMAIESACRVDYCVEELIGNVIYHSKNRKCELVISLLSPEAEGCMLVEILKQQWKAFVLCKNQFH